MGGAAMATTEAEQIVTRFVAAWERADVDELLDYFSEDAVWVRGPMKPLIGKPALRDAISTEWFGAVTHLGAEIHAQVSDGKIVMHERTDRFMLGDREMASSIGAAFEIENGLITAWREYFDLPPEFRS
jgi:limonene-1,2-epoxide hydrolase